MDSGICSNVAGLQSIIDAVEQVFRRYVGLYEVPAIAADVTTDGEPKAGGGHDLRQGFGWAICA